MFMERNKPPTSDEQFETYRNMAQVMEGRPVVIRTLDVGGDKDIPYLPLEKEENPSLGHRAIRFSLLHEDLFRAQLSAILRAAAFGKISLMIPLLTSIQELRRVKEMLEEVKSELRLSGKIFAEETELGVMLETPAAVLCADQLARECDFFSIGTNDLTQYTLAVDRSNVHISPMYCDHHPAVLRMVKMAVDAANRAGIPISVCGEAGADPIIVPILLGLGVRKFSVAISSLLSVRSQINHLSCKYWERLIPQILAQDTPEEVLEFVEEHLEREKELAARE
jgi:phosphotransferase system enzyme I (PtsI)